jgi:hypothetical protein
MNLSDAAIRILKIVRVEQKNAMGCGVACLAMITGKSYDDIALSFDPKQLDEDGLDFATLDAYLAEHGYATRLLSHARHGESEWPPDPFGPIHICQIRRQKFGDATHFVVMDRWGGVFDPDPAFDRVGSLRDYVGILTVAAVGMLRE